MNFLTKFATLGLLILLLLNQFGSIEASDIRYLDESIMRSIGMALWFIPPPLGPILAIFSSILTEIYSHYKHQQYDQQLLDVQTFRERIDKFQDYIQEHDQKIIDDVTEAIHKWTLVKDLREDISDLYSCFDKGCENCLVLQKCSPDHANIIIGNLINPASKYRNTLSGLVSNYITATSTPLHYAYDFDLIFEVQMKNHLIEVKNSRYCGSRSEQTKMYELATYIIKMLARSYAMVSLAYMHEQNDCLKRYDLTDAFRYRDELLERMDYMHRQIDLVVSTVHKTLKNVSRDIQACLPETQIEGVTYEPLNNLIRAEPHRYDCAEMGAKNQKESREGDLHMELFGVQNNSPHKICTVKENINTVYFNRTGEKLYHAFTEESQFYTEYNEKNVLGRVTNRSQLERKFIGNYCKTYVCYVDQSHDKKSMWKFSTAPVVAPRGCVLTGIRWVVRNHVVYPEIQYAKYINKTIDVDSVTWSPQQPENLNKTLELNLKHRSFDFDDVILPPGSLVTGIKFIRNRWNSISIHVYGVTAKGEEIIQYPDESYERKEIKLDNVEGSEYTINNYHQVVSSKPGKHWIQFQGTDLIKDAGSTTVPYLNIRPVRTFPLAPVSGIGTFFRGPKFYGGYISLKLISVDVAPNLDAVKMNEYADRICTNIKALRTLFFNAFQRKKQLGSLNNTMDSTSTKSTSIFDV